jgi:hypothetical protein
MPHAAGKLKCPPMVASFAMDGLTISKAQAFPANGSGFIPVR